MVSTRSTNSSRRPEKLTVEYLKELRRCKMFYVTVAVGFICAVMVHPVSAATLLDVPYGLEESQKLDLYEPPQSNEKKPAVILIHGGGWVSGDKRDYAYVAQLAAARGILAVAINYHLTDGSSKGIWPAQLDDVQAAVKWVRSHATALGVAPDRICALGSSAGGHLAAFLAVLRKPIEEHVDCAVDEFGPVDLVDFFHGQTPENMFGKVEPAMRQHILEQASPVNFVTEGTAPMLIVQGTRDTMVKPEQSERIRNALQNAGVEAQYFTYAGGHGFSGLSAAEYTAQQEKELDFVVGDKIP
jgi:acetyl esterase/lipase